MTKLSTIHSLRKKSDDHLQKIGFSTIGSSRYTIDLLMVGADEIVNSFHFPIVAYAEINVFANLNRIGYPDCICVFIFFFNNRRRLRLRLILNVQRHIENPAKSLK